MPKTTVNATIHLYERSLPLFVVLAEFLHKKVPSKKYHGVPQMISS